MEIILIRHGEPDYSPCDKREFIGHGRGLAPLSKLGVEQAEQVALDKRLCGSDIMISSPYPRALQTAAIISRVSGVKITVEMDMREWEPDKTFQFGSSKEADNLYQDFCNCKGVYPKGESRKWEQVEEIIKRIKPIAKYYFENKYKKIVIVCHGGIIRRFTGEPNIEYCTPYVIQYDDNFEFFKWVE